MAKRIISVGVLPGEPTDGSGIVCIHLFVQDDKGPFTEPHVLQPGPSKDQKVVAKRIRGRLACDPKKLVAPTTRGGITKVTMRTDDPRAVTCPKCKNSPDYERLMNLQGS